VDISIHYPDGTIGSVTKKTGLMLTLHNWGGTFCAGTANPDALARRLDVVAICVNYLQSGRQASIEDPEPYDFGYLQGLDALRALWFVDDGLRQKELPFDSGRMFATGGSGGGNVTQMVNKLAPRTFACVIDMCGMAKLSDDMAFNLPGGSGLDARWSRDSDSPNWLSPAAQEIRFIGNPAHLAVAKRLKNACKIVVVHGVDDGTCRFEEKKELVENMQAAGLDVEPHFISKDDLDGKVFTSSGHALGNRTEIVFRVAGKYLESGHAETSRRRTGLSDFESRDAVTYPVTGGQYVVSYERGYPVTKLVAERSSDSAN
jgi:predicted esterase